MFDVYYYRDSLLDASLWSMLLAGIKALALVISFFAILGIIIVVARASQLPARKSVLEETAEFLNPETEDDTVPQETETQRVARERWVNIQKDLAKSEHKDYKLAIIEADGLVDYVLKAYGYQGETMSDRIRAVRHQDVPSLEHLWDAHKIRNEAVHNPAYVVYPEQGARALNAYEQVLRELEVL